MEFRFRLDRVQDDVQASVQDEVRAAVHHLMSAADRLDLDSFTAMFHPDADFHNPIGMVLRGRDEIRRLHEKLYSPNPPPGYPSFVNARATGRIQAIHMVGHDEVAIVDWTWTQHGAQSDGQPWPDREGCNTLVWLRDNDGAWRVIAWRDKDFPSGFEHPPGETGAVDTRYAESG